MKGLTVFILVIVTVSLVRSQGLPTRTKKGKRPQRLSLKAPGDNTDVGLPSGQDFPDNPGKGKPAPPAGGAPPPPAGGPPTKTKSGPAPPKGKGGAPPPPANGPPPAGGVAPPPAGGPPPPGGVAPPKRPGDNTDRGLPSGRDFPDNPDKRKPAPPAPGKPVAPLPLTKTKSGPPPVRYAIPKPNNGPNGGKPAGQKKPARFNHPPALSRPVKKNNNNGKPKPKFTPQSFFSYFPFAQYFFPQVPVQQSCDASCPITWAPVCSTFGNTYDNNCLLNCRNEKKECDGECPCNQDYAAPIVQSQCNCGWNEFNPVCSEDEVQYNNACEANCAGATIMCSSHCPC